MLQNKVSKMIQLISIILLFTFLFVSCGGDSPTKPPVVVPEGLSSVAGDYIKAVMGDTTAIEFIAVDAAQNPVSNSWINFSALVGDGAFVNDSVKTDSLGKAVCQYLFNGNLGHAEIQALIRNIDSVTVSVRASTLIPGATGQGQYILLEDNYTDVKNFNGLPVSLDVFSAAKIIVANYESTLGVVFVMSDVDSNAILSDNEPVVGIIVNTLYTGKTKDSLGIGSSIVDVMNIYTDSVVTFDPTPPPAYSFRYPAVGFTFWTDTTANILNRVVFEIHLTEFITVPVAKQNDLSSNSKSFEAVATYKRYGK